MGENRCPHRVQAAIKRFSRGAAGEQEPASSRQFGPKKWPELSTFSFSPKLILEISQSSSMDRGEREEEGKMKISFSCFSFLGE